MFLLGGAHLRWVWVDMRWVGLDFSCQDDKQRHCKNKCEQGPAMHTYFLDCLLVCLFVFVCDVLVFPKEEEGERTEREARRKGGRRGGEESREQEKSREGLAEISKYNHTCTRLGMPGLASCRGGG